MTGRVTEKCDAIGRGDERLSVLTSGRPMSESLTRAPGARSAWRGFGGAGNRALPGSSAQGSGAPAVAPLGGARVGRWRALLARCASVRLRGLSTLASAGVVALFVVCASVPELLAPFPPTEMSGEAVLSAPSGEHWFGTDQFGRDVFSLVVFGARQSLLVGVCAVLVGCGLGVGIGICAGYFGRWLDMLLMRFVDVWMAVPNILLAIALSTALGPSLGTTILAVSVASVPRYARVLRGRALAVKSEGFVLAARACGASNWAILRRHVLPHCLAPMLVLATLGVGNAILTASSLSFLGLGINDDRPDWGYQLTQGRAYLTVAWWAVTYPGLALTALVISVNLLGDALRRRLDPRRVMTLRGGV
jgi:peptide/nickel transport system permease protein